MNNTDLFCIQSGLISMKCMANVSRVTSCCNCFRACRSSMPNAASVALHIVPILVELLVDNAFTFDDVRLVAAVDVVAAIADAVMDTSPPTVSSLTAQSTNGSYTNASSNVSNVSRPRFNVFNTCSHAKRNVPCKN